ncbi:MAG TPA: protein phosphatase 2C domain-containing protein, partial [Blastocatellia bacterium]|nr:protein phosphatase 2C domain-containing protein [Blastocatellia bacterium]
CRRPLTGEQSKTPIAFMAELPTINLALYAQTDVGMVRSGNEDNFLILDLSSGRNWIASEEEPPELLTYAQGYYGSLMAVSDGMGGALAGEVASRMAVETVRDRMLQLQAHEVYSRLSFHERLRLSIEEANIQIHSESTTNPAHKGLGATFTAVAALGADIYFGQVGDSRAYMIRKNEIARITKDQSLVQQLIDAGQITEEEAETHSYRNVILQALGAHSTVNVEVSRLTLCNRDTLVICSDGLSGKVHQDEILQIIHESQDFKSACQRLINLANERGGEDNITVVIAQFSGDGLAEPESAAMEPQSLARSPDTPSEINWGNAAETTDHLTRPSAPTDDLSQIANATTTEPLPVPAAQSASKADSAATARLTTHTTDPLNPPGQTTAVFSVEDLNDDPSASPTPSELPSLQARTAPLEAALDATAEAMSHDARAAHPQNSTAPLTHNSATAKAVSKPLSKPAEPPAYSTASKSPSSEGRSRRNIFIVTVLLALVIGGSIIGGYSYVKQQAQAEEQQARKDENQKKKNIQIGGLREKIHELNQRLQVPDKPSSQKKRDISENLDRLSQRLDEINKMSLDQLNEIRQECEEIGKELEKIEAEVDNLQGLLPPLDTNRDPIKI